MKIDSVNLYGVTDFLADDYGNLYLYKSKNFSWTRYDNSGKEQGRLMLPQPYSIQEVQNPLFISLFSQNAQAIKFVDSHFTEIQQIDLTQNFGFISAVFVEDLQTAWLLEETTNRLIQYYYRDGKVINSYPVSFSFGSIKSMLVYNRKIFILKENAFEVYNFDGKLLQSNVITDGRKILRENDKLFILCKNSAWEYLPEGNIRLIMEDGLAKNLTKNNNTIFVIKENKIYLYPLN